MSLVFGSFILDIQELLQLIFSFKSGFILQGKVHFSLLSIFSHHELLDFTISIIYLTLHYTLLFDILCGGL